MMLRVGLTIALLVAWLPALTAGGQSWKWWEAPEAKTELSLTDEQSAGIERIFQEALPKLRASKDELDRLEHKLSKLISAATASEVQVSELIDRVEASRSDLSRARTLMLYRFHRVLSPEQRVKLKTLYERRQKARGRSDTQR